MKENIKKVNFMIINKYKLTYFLHKKYKKYYILCYVKMTF